MQIPYTALPPPACPYPAQGACAAGLGHSGELLEGLARPVWDQRGRVSTLQQQSFTHMLILRSAHQVSLQLGEKKKAGWVLTIGKLKEVMDIQVVIFITLGWNWKGMKQGLASPQFKCGFWYKHKECYSPISPLTSRRRIPGGGCGGNTQLRKHYNLYKHRKALSMLKANRPGWMVLEVEVISASSTSHSS